MATQDIIHAASPAKASPLYDPKIRSIVFQVLLILSLVLGIWWIADNTVENLRRSNISTGFDFLRGRAGFDIGFSMIDYSSDSTFARALVAGILNTLLVAGDWHHHRDDHRLPCRRRPTVEELADPQDRHRLCRSVPQHSAAAGHPVLVPGRAGAAAQCSRQPWPSVRLIPQQSRLLFSALRVGRRLLADPRRPGCRHRLEHLRRQPRQSAPNGDRAAVPGASHQPGADHRLPAAGLGAGRISRDGGFPAEAEVST